ncbi:hypothetical protein QTO05_20010 [Vibrio fortis]|uniref:hypothetical protein n=1 Tax=Vibrio fortis TaxID=212667 RepID=UPI002F401FD7
MIIQSVRADTGGREGKWVALIIASILGFATLAIPYHQAEIHVTTAFEQGSGYYFSSPKLEGFADSFLMNANSIAPEIWINLKGQVEAPTKFDLDSLSAAGWKQVVTESEAMLNQYHEDDAH